MTQQFTDIISVAVGAILSGILGYMMTYGIALLFRTRR